MMGSKVGIVLLSTCLIYASFLLIRYSFAETEKFIFNSVKALVFIVIGAIGLSVGIHGLLLMLLLAIA